MSSYTITNPALNPKRVFILQKSELEKRFDPFFYIPELLELEKKVLAKQPKKLRDYVVSVSSGATPKRDEKEKYYSDKENGIPFLRVQNVTEFGLDLSDVKFINKETHENYLKRSQVSENDLLVTITGRIASAAVAPKDFIGNINQHSVVVKTASKEISEMLAAFLNCSIGQKLANRLSAGGTRPALDYPALLSIPIIEDKRILEITNKVILQKQTNEAEAEKLLASIDDYLLGELGITLPVEKAYFNINFQNRVAEPRLEYGNYRFIEEKFELDQQNKLVQQKRIFITNFSEVVNKRFDANYHQPRFTNNLNAVFSGKYPVKQLREIITGNLIKGSLPKQDEKEGECSVVQINSINNDGTISLDDLLTAKPIFSYSQRLIENDVLVVITGATIGKIAFWNYEGEYFLGGDIVKFQTNDFADNSFVFNFLRSVIMQTEIKRNITGATNGHLAPRDVANLPIPVPPLDKQKEIAEHITGIRQQAQQLKDKTKELLKKASGEIEEILLN